MTTRGWSDAVPDRACFLRGGAAHAEAAVSPAVLSALEAASRRDRARARGAPGRSLGIRGGAVHATFENRRNEITSGGRVGHSLRCQSNRPGADTRRPGSPLAAVPAPCGVTRWSPDAGATSLPRASRLSASRALSIGDTPRQVSTLLTIQRRQTLAAISPLVRRSLALARSDSLYRNSTFLAANAVISAVMGFVFWAVAARTLSPQAVGVAAAVVTAATLVASFSFLGFDNALIKYLPTSSTKDQDTHTGLTVTGAASIAGACIALAIAAESGSKLRLLVSSPWSMMAFGGLCFLSSWNYITNVIFIAGRVAQYVFLTTVAFCVVRLPLLFLFEHDGYAGATLAWLIGSAASVVASFFILYRVSDYSYRPSFDLPGARRMVRFAAANYVSGAASSLPALVFPSLILSVTGPEYSAYFYVVYLVMACVLQLPLAVCQSLFAEGSRDRVNMWAHVRKATKVAIMIMLPSLVVILAVGYPLLGLFGRAYATHGFGCLCVLCLSGIPTVGGYIGGTVLRIANRVHTLVVGSILGAAVAGSVGIAGLIEFRSLVVVAAGICAGQIVLCSVFTREVDRLYRAEQRALARHLAPAGRRHARA